jgi:hypothetical protein
VLLLNYFITQVRYWYHRLLTPDPHKGPRCPGCGLIGKKKVKFSHVYTKVLLTCPRCVAVWGVDPVVPYSAWLVKDYQEILDEQGAEEIRKLQERENRELGIKR